MEYFHENTVFIDDSGKKLAAIVPIKTYQKMFDIIDDIEDVKLYEKAKKEDKDDSIS